MQITEIRQVPVALEGAISNSVVSFADHDVSLVAVVSDVIRNGRPVTGVAFNSIGRFAQPGLLTERFIPRVLAADPESLLSASGSIDPAKVYTAAMRNEKPGGHGDRAGAVAAIELAVWDLNAKLADEPAHRTIGRYFDRPEPTCGVEVYAAGGYYTAGGTHQTLIDEMQGYIEAGFPAYKMKIGGASLAEDLGRIEAALTVISDSRALAVDANGRLDPQTALDYAKALRPYDIGWYEEAGDPLDFDLNRAVAEEYGGPVATGENLFSRPDARNLARYGGMRPGIDTFMMEAGLSYGLTEYAGMIDDLEALGHDRTQASPHGGHLINLHIVHGLELGRCEVYPGVFNPFGGYSPQCRLSEGRITPSDAPGFGLEQKPELSPHIDALTA